MLENISGICEALQMSKPRVCQPVDFHLKALLTDGSPRHSRRIQAHKGPLQIYRLQQVTAIKAGICSVFNLSASA